MTTKLIESRVDFYLLIDDIERQLKEMPKLSKIEIAEKFFSEKHEIALRFYRFHQEMKSGGLSQWKANGLMKEDFDILFECVEKGYAQQLIGFHSLMSVFELIGNIEGEESFQYRKKERKDCEECDGTGGTYANGKCSYCKGSGLLASVIEIEVESEEGYNQVLKIVDEEYFKLTEKERIHSFEEYINKMEEDAIDVEQALIRRRKTKKIKPDCKLIGEDGNVFNLQAIVVRTLKRNNLNEEAEEVTKRLWEAKSYGQALRIFMDYVDVI